MKTRLLGLFCACVLLSVSSIAGASTIKLSDISSDQGEMNDPTDPVDLDALLTFMVSGVGGTTLTLSVTNNTDSTANTFDMTEIFFNVTSNITSISLTSPTATDAPTGWDFFTDDGTPQSPTKANGFGNFDVAVKVHGDINANPNIVDPGETEVLLFALTCVATCDMADFVAENADGYTAAAKFVNGPGADSAFGATNPGEFPPIPVPAAVWLFGSGLIGLVGVARRRKKDML